MIDKKNSLDSNMPEKTSVSNVERKNWVKKFSKKITPALLATMLALDSNAADIDISKLPNYASVDCKKYGMLNVCVGTKSWNDKYNTDYYDRYNKEVRNLEDTNLAGIENLNIVNGAMILDGYKYELNSFSYVTPDYDFLKRNDLDKVIVNIDGVNFKARPKFLKLNFVRDGKKGVFGYHMEKSLTLVYVPYLDKIKLLGIIDNYAGFIDTSPKEYEVSSNIENKKKIYSIVANLIGCSGSCRYKKTLNSDIYFYSGNRLIGQIQDMGDEKYILKGNKLVGKIIQKGNKVLVIDNSSRVLYKSGGFKNLNIFIPEIDAKIILNLDN